MLLSTVFPVAALLCAIVVPVWSRLNRGLLSRWRCVWAGRLWRQDVDPPSDGGLSGAAVLTVLGAGRASVWTCAAKRHARTGRGYTSAAAGAGQPGFCRRFSPFAAVVWNRQEPATSGQFAMLAPVAMAVAHEAGIPSF